MMKSFVAAVGVLWCLVSFASTFIPFSAQADQIKSDDVCITTMTTPVDPTAKSHGSEIITSVFDQINSILSTISQQFYNNILKNNDFQKIVNVLVVLYLTVYGVMIMFNLAPAQTGEIVNRLIKIGIVYSVVSTATGWEFFSQYIANPILYGDGKNPGIINQLIQQFSVAAGNAAPITIDVKNGQALTANAMASLFVPIGQVISVKFFVAIFSLTFMGNFGWLIAFFLLWGLMDFVFMLIGAVSTYLKAIVGLAFLFGIAPIFFLFLLFEKTRQVFVGWTNQVAGFAVQPVLLFAFLSFYVQLVSVALTSILNAADYCYVSWINLGIIDIHMWRPTIMKNGVKVAVEGAWGYNPSAINIMDVLYFLLLCHLGKSFCKFIEQLSRDLSAGSGAGVTSGKEVKSWFKNNITGGRGTVDAVGAAWANKSKALSVGRATFSTVGSVARKVSSDAKSAYSSLRNEEVVSSRPTPAGGGTSSTHAPVEMVNDLPAETKPVQAAVTTTTTLAGGEQGQSTLSDHLKSYENAQDEGKKEEIAKEIAKSSGITDTGDTNN